MYMCEMIEGIELEHLRLALAKARKEISEKTNPTLVTITNCD